jgi:hypothetical protein
MSKVNVLFARFPGGASEHPDTSDWLVQTVIKAKADPRIDKVFHWRIDDTPITMGRNRCIKQAKKAGADVVVMIDSDMKPDAYLPGNPHALGHDPLARPFWDSSFDFLMKHQGPCAVAAPYCGRPPHENIFVFQWAHLQDDHPNVDVKLDQYSREEAARMMGIQEAAALPTGLFMFHTAAVDVLTPPYFTYEWADEEQTEKASTEDVVFTRDLSLAGVKQYCNWDAWAGHWKLKCVPRPTLLACNDVRENFRQAVLRNQPSNERLLVLEERKPPANGQGRPRKRTKQRA